VKTVLAIVVGVGALVQGAQAQSAVQWRVQDGGNGAGGMHGRDGGYAPVVHHRRGGSPPLQAEGRGGFCCLAQPARVDSLLRDQYTNRTRAAPIDRYQCVPRKLALSEQTSAPGPEKRSPASEDRTP